MIRVYDVDSTQIQSVDYVHEMIKDALHPPADLHHVPFMIDATFWPNQHWNGEGAVGHPRFVGGGYATGWILTPY